VCPTFEKWLRSKLDWQSKHRLANGGAEPLVMIETQCGDYLGEDDIVRFDDRYGRAPA
jgi:mannose-1-phosphate guanylyltransferase